MNPILIMALLVNAQSYPPQCKGDLRHQKVTMEKDYACPFNGMIYTHDADKCLKNTISWYRIRWRNDTLKEKLRCETYKDNTQQVLKHLVECVNMKTRYRDSISKRNKWYYQPWFIAGVGVLVGSFITGMTVYGVMK